MRSWRRRAVEVCHKMNKISDSVFVYSAKNSGLPEGFIQKVPDLFSEKGLCIHNARNQIKVYEEGGMKINVKKYCIPPIINRILYSIGLRRPKAKSAYLNAVKLRQMGFDTPKPFGYIIQRKYGIINYSYFISEQLNMPRMGHDCKNRELIKALAEYTAKMHEHGLIDKDFTANNILYSREGKNYHFALVDINRFKFKKKAVGMLQSCQTLMKPLRSENKLKFFVSRYAECRGFNKRFMTERVIFLRRRRNLYEIVKKFMKKLPGAKYVTGKNLRKKK